ncbi:MAG: hypothetical protein N2512_09875 [Armatimonadetes bacterium]|nr:hypothetical protein [Armatimonadota bacterium]
MSSFLAEPHERVVRIPTSLIVGVGNWGSRAAGRAAEALFSFAPQLEAIVRFLALRQENGEVVSLCGWPWSIDRTVPSSDEAAWEALEASAEQITKALATQIIDARSINHDELLRNCGIQRLVLPDQTLVVDIFVIADYGEPGAGLWASEIATAARARVRELAPRTQSHVIGIGAVLEGNATGQELLVRRARGLLRLKEQDALAGGLATGSGVPFEVSGLTLPGDLGILARDRWPLFDVFLYLGEENVLGHRLPEGTLAGLAGRLVELYLLTHEQLTTKEGGEAGLLHVPEQRVAAGRTYYGSIGCAAVYYPRREMLTYAAARVAMVAIRRCGLLPCRQIDEEELAEAEKRFVAIFGAARLSFRPEAFLNSLEEAVAHDNEGNKLLAPTGWEVAADERRMERWPEEIADYELLLLSKLRRASYLITENALRVGEGLASAVREMTDEAISDAGKGIRWAEQVLQRGKQMLDQFWRDFSRRRHTDPPDTDKARKALAEAIARMPNAVFLLTRAMLMGVPLGLFVRAVVEPRWPILPGGLSFAVGPLISLFLASVFWLVRHADVLRKRARAVRAVEEKAREGLRELVRQQVEPLIRWVGAEVDAELSRLCGLRAALASAEFRVWRAHALPQVGEYVAWTTLGDRYGPRGRDREYWQGSPVLEDFDRWDQSPLQPSAPAWQDEALQATVIQPSEFEGLVVTSSVVYAEDDGPQQLWQELVNQTGLYRGWREGVGANPSAWAVQTADRLVSYLAEAPTHFQDWRRKTVDDVLAEQAEEDKKLGREPGRVAVLWQETVEKLAAPSAEPRTECLSGVEAVYALRALFAPSIQVATNSPADTGAVTPFGEMAVAKGFDKFLPCSSPVHSFVVNGFAGVPLECLGYVVPRLQQAFADLPAEARSTVQVSNRSTLPDQ